jgi:hypothetical protein
VSNVGDNGNLYGGELFDPWLRRGHIPTGASKGLLPMKRSALDRGLVVRHDPEQIQIDPASEAAALWPLSDRMGGESSTAWAQRNAASHGCRPGDPDNGSGTRLFL